jgi:competence protein ComEA
MARVVGSPFAKPVARVVVVAAGLVLLAIIGRVTSAGAFGGAPPAAILPIDASAYFPPAPANAMGASPTLAGQPSPIAGGAVASPIAPTAGAPSTAGAAPAWPSPGGPQPAAGAQPAGTSPAGHGSASPDDPVFLNAAAVDDLRRLPGIGPKRADAILALRARLGRFRAIEDLLKVKGVGRATLKRLRPLVRLDAPVLADAGTAPRAND